MADDLSRTPHTGLTVQLCGDAHLSNFGVFGSPERRLVFDLNDFDETLPGPFEWDLKRLVASTAVAGRDNGLGRRQRRAVAMATTAAYRTSMHAFAAQPALAVFYARFDVDDELARMRKHLSKARTRKVEKRSAKSRTRDGRQALAKITTVVDGRRRIVSDPPLIVPFEELASPDQVAELTEVMGDLVQGYSSTLTANQRWLVEQFSLTQVARKVVGVGSVGTRAWVLLMEAGDGLDPLLLQAKEATRSVLSGYLGESEFEEQGERVVTGQRRLQAVSDVLLGWQRVVRRDGEQHDYYLRQLRDWKDSPDIATMDAETLALYGELCGQTLARAHARTGDRIAIAAYLGTSDRVDRALADFAESYADLTEGDHAALAAAVAAGRAESRDDL